MTKKRLTIILGVFIMIFCVIMFPSTLFKIRKFSINFFDDYGNVINFRDNILFNSNEKVDSILKNIDYEESIFLFKKDKFKNDIEKQNRYIKVLNIERKFPNGVEVNLLERKPQFYITYSDSFFVVDDEFVILEITNKKNNDLIEIETEKTAKISYCDFFNLPFIVISSAISLGENNIFFQKIENYKIILKKHNLSSDFLMSFIITETKTANLKVKTQNGIYLEIENVFLYFNEKFDKLLFAFETLYENEKIKTTYGTLKIDDCLNCYWNKM